MSRTSFENPLYAEEMNILDFLKQPDVTIIQALLLKFKPVNMDVLPLYIVLLLLFPPILWLLLRRPTSRWRVGGALRRRPGNSAGTCRPIRAATGSSIRSPGNCCSCSAPGARSAARERLSAVLQSQVTLAIAIAYLLFAFYHHDDLVLARGMAGMVPHWLEDVIYPIDKTNLDVLRFAHFLALAAVTVLFIPRDWPALKSRAFWPADPVRAAFAGNLLPWRVPGLCRRISPWWRFPARCGCRSWSALLGILIMVAAAA